MCLAVPGQITQMAEGGRATVDMMGVTQEVSLRLVPDARPGDYVLVHAGFAIQVVDEQEAAEILAIFRDLSEYAGEDLGTDPIATVGDAAAENATAGACA